jgi:hypothetical protein
MAWARHFNHLAFAKACYSGASDSDHHQYIEIYIMSDVKDMLMARQLVSLESGDFVDEYQHKGKRGFVIFSLLGDEVFLALDDEEFDIWHSPADSLLLLRKHMQVVTTDQRREFAISSLILPCRVLGFPPRPYGMTEPNFDGKESHRLEYQGLALENSLDHTLRI